VALLAARGLLLAYAAVTDPDVQLQAARLAGASIASWAPAATLLFPGALLALVDLGTPGTARRRRKRLA
jgi:hypothetical protein